MWTKLEPIVENPTDQPSPREGHVAILIDGDKMLVHGGINESNKCFNDAYILLGLHQEIDFAQSLIKYDAEGKIVNGSALKLLRGKKEMVRWVRCE